MGGIVVFDEKNFMYKWDQMNDVKKNIKVTLDLLSKAYESLANSDNWDGLGATRFLSMKNSFTSNKDLIEQKFDIIEKYVSTVVNNFYYEQENMTEMIDI